ncbi:MAG TPA: hypothetical protein VI408_05405 [Gaiellaceae bacterium]
MLTRLSVVAGAAALGLASAIGSGAATRQESGLILYRTPPSTTATPAVVQLWTTDGAGTNAREVISLEPVGASEALRSAYLVPDGLVLAEPSPADGNVSELAFVKRGSHRARILFSVRGLYSFRPSPDGSEIVYSRSLPVAGKPLLMVVRRDGSLVRTLAHATSKSLSWSSDGRRIFAYGVNADCWFCVFSAATGKQGAISSINLDNLWGGWPSVSPSGKKVAFPDAKGPAGERIYTTRGGFLRNLVGAAAPYAFWSPDDARLLLQPQDAPPRLFSFRTKALTRFRHDGPPDLIALDWR